MIEGIALERTIGFRKVAAVCGIASQIITIVVLVVAGLKSPWFDWTTDHLSAFGVEGEVKLLYNGGLIAAGILGVIFAIGLGRFFLLGRLGQLSVGLFVLGSLAALTMGLFPRNWDFIHGASTVAFFVCITLALLAAGFTALNIQQKRWGIMSLTAGVLVGGIQIVFGPLHGGAIGQVAAWLAWSVWTIALGVVLLRNPDSLQSN